MLNPLHIAKENLRNKVSGESEPIFLAPFEGGAGVEPKGILPISQSTITPKPLIYSSEYPLVGSGQPYSDCGSYFTIGCLEADSHKGMNLDGVNMEGKAYLERKKVSCHRPLCPICWGDWASRETKKATKRLNAFKLKGRTLKPIHIMVSVPHSDYVMTIEAMRKKVYRVLKAVHCLGGVMIYHSKRQNRFKSWYYSPHFHILGYGWLQDVRKNYLGFGYIVKNLQVRKSIEGTIWYQLSHCAIPSKRHSITWFGCLSYNKLRVEPEIEQPDLCPICGSELSRVVYVGPGKEPDLDHDGGFFDDVKNWCYRPGLMTS